MAFIRNKVISRSRQSKGTRGWLLIRPGIYTKKSHFPFWSSDRNWWAVMFSRNSISGIDRESGLYPEWGWLWGIRSSRQINEHSQFVELTFSKSSIWWGGTLELTFHMSICNLSAYMRISTYTMQIYLCGFMQICPYKSA